MYIYISEYVAFSENAKTPVFLPYILHRSARVLSAAGVPKRQNRAEPVPNP
jgi:hypothetical protein